MNKDVRERVNIWTCHLWKLWKCDILACKNKAASNQLQMRIEDLFTLCLKHYIINAAESSSHSNNFVSLNIPMFGFGFGFCYRSLSFPRHDCRNACLIVCDRPTSSLWYSLRPKPWPKSGDGVVLAKVDRQDPQNRQFNEDLSCCLNLFCAAQMWH